MVHKNAIAPGNYNVPKHSHKTNSKRYHILYNGWKYR